MDPVRNQFVPLHEMNEEGEKVPKTSGAFTKSLHAQIAATAKVKAEGRLLRPDGSPVPEHWGVYLVGEEVALKNHIFRVGYIGENTLLLEAVGPVLLSQEGATR